MKISSRHIPMYRTTNSKRIFLKSLKLKILFNFTGTVLPMLVGLFIIPILIKKIGIERFGMLSIAWMLVGYFGLLDMGLGRALTQKVAERIGTKQTENIKAIIWKAISIVTLFGMVGSFLLFFSTEWLVYDLFNMSVNYQKESEIGLYWLAATIPIVIVSTGLFGVLEGQQYFGLTALVRAPLGVMIFLAPLLAAQHSESLSWVLGSLFFVRLAALITLILITIHTLKHYKGWTTAKGELRNLFKFGGWVTVTNIVSPVMVYFDRFYIASVLLVSLVAYYTTPFDLLTKSLIVPFAIVGVMFTSFANHWQQDKLKVIKQFKISMIAIVFMMLPFSIIIFSFAKMGMTLWLGEEFAEQSYKIVQWLAIGIFFNALAMVPFAFIQAIGRADITAKLHLVELPFYIIALWFFVSKYGLIGAAIAWVTRVLVDAFMLLILSSAIIKNSTAEV